MEKGWRPPPQYTTHPQPESPHPERGEEDGRGREVGGGSKMAGGCGKVTVIITNLTVGPDGCGGWAICFGSGGSSDLLWEAKPPGRNSSGW